MNRTTAQRRLKEIADDVGQKTAAGMLTAADMDRAERQAAELETAIKSYDAAARLSGAADMYPAPSTARTTGARWNPPSPLHGTESQRKRLFAAEPCAGDFR
jgi:hypothetical protein